MRAFGGAGDERVGRRSAGRAGHCAGLRTGWQAGPSVTHERASRRAGLRLSQMAGLRAARASKPPRCRANLASKPCRQAAGRSYLG